MRYEKILEVLAPCGLSCKKCIANREGEIFKHSSELKRLLGNFDRTADRFSAFLPVFKDYSAFKAVLDFFARAECRGCRKGDCKYPRCGVAPCYTSKGVDFCFQCEEFPCENSNFDPDLHERWLKMNRRMKEIGVEAYYQETKDMPRYG